MAAIEDIIAWCAAERARLAGRLERLESGGLRTYEKQAQPPGWLEIDTTAQSIELCRQYISEFNALIANEATASAPGPAAAPAAPATGSRSMAEFLERAHAGQEHDPPPPDLTHPGWVNGWCVVAGRDPNWRCIGIYETRAEADDAAAQAGERYYVRWGGYNRRTNDFLAGPLKLS